MDSKVIPFFTDQNVPDSVGNYILESGHNLVRLRDVMPTDTKDPIIAVACEQYGQVLITHDQDFKSSAKRLGITQKQYQGLHRVLMRCPEPMSASRLSLAMELIKREWEYASGTQPLNIEVREHSIITHR
jgi:predicted nuclease of predicted toxin-antitoxin system